MLTTASMDRTRFGALESLRGIAALCVVFYHLDWINSVTGLNFFRNSFLMVDFFFVLSGFVIYHSYSTRIESLASAGRFVFLRIGRLYPLHLATLLVFLFIEISKYIAEVRYGLVANTPAFTVNNASSFFANFFMVHAWNFQERPTWNGPSWSISAEFFAYLSFALVMLVFRKNTRVLSAFALGLSLLCFFYLYNRVGHLDVYAQDSILRCIAGFYLGVFVYRIRTVSFPWLGSGKFDALINMILVCAFSGIALLMALAQDNRTDFFQPALFAIVVLSVSLLPHNYGLNAILNLGPLRWLGMVSYSIYMIHQIVLWIATQFLRVVLKVPESSGTLDPGLLVGNALMLVSVALVLVASHYSFRYVEDRYRRMSRNWAGKIWSTNGLVRQEGVAGQDRVAGD